MDIPDMAAFARAEIAGRVPAGAGFPHALWARIGAAGLFRIGLPPAHGGSGGGAAAIAAGEAALIRLGGSPGLGACWAAHQMVARCFVAAHGDAAQQARLLPELAAGRLTAAVAISEPGVGAHPKHLTTRAARVDGQWVLDGEKSYASNGGIAGLFIVLAITGVEAGRKRYSALLVPRDAAGLTVLEAPTPAALHPATHCALRLEGVRLDGAALLGPEGEAFPAMALPFRDAEDAVAAAGLAATLQLAVEALAAAIGSEQAAELGELAGLAAVAAHAAGLPPTALDEGRLDALEMQAVLIGLRQIAATLLQRIRAEHRAAAAVGSLALLLEGIAVSLSVARGPRRARAARLGLSLAGGG